MCLNPQSPLLSEWFSSFLLHFQPWEGPLRKAKAFISVQNGYTQRLGEKSVIIESDRHVIVSLWGQKCTILDSLWFRKSYRHSHPPTLTFERQPNCHNKMLAMIRHTADIFHINISTIPVISRSFTYTLDVYELIILLGGGGIGGGGTPRQEGCQARDHCSRPLQSTNKPCHFSDRWDILQPCLWPLKWLFWKRHWESFQPNLWWLKVGI